MYPCPFQVSKSRLVPVRQVNGFYFIQGTNFPAATEPAKDAAPLFPYSQYRHSDHPTLYAKPSRTPHINPRRRLETTIIPGLVGFRSYFFNHGGMSAPDIVDHQTATQSPSPPSSQDFPVPGPWASSQLEPYVWLPVHLHLQAFFFILAEVVEGMTHQPPHTKQAPNKQQHNWHFLSWREDTSDFGSDVQLSGRHQWP